MSFKQDSIRGTFRFLMHISDMYLRMVETLSHMSKELATQLTFTNFSYQLQKYMLEFFDHEML